MKKKLLLILLLLSSCASTQKNDIIIHDLDVDFPTAETVSMEYKQTFNMIYYSEEIAVKDTAIFALGYNNDNMGYCYNINNGNLITPIINRGKAANEIIAEDYSLNIMLHKDTIQFIDNGLHEIKSITMDDVVTKHVGERVVSKINTPKANLSFNFKKVDNNIVIGQNFDPKEGQKYFIFDGNELSLFGEYNEKIYKSNGNKKLSSNILSMVCQPKFANHGSKIISADKHGVTLELIDANTKNVIKDRFYTIIPIEEMDEKGGSPPLMDLNTKRVYCTDNEIYCIVTLLDKLKTKEEKKKFVDIFILVFDWDLNPIKKYYIGSSTNRGYTICMTEDCKKFYYLANEGEKQTLFEGLIN